MDTQLEDSVVLVTGSTRGIGAAAAESFLEEGAHVVINGRREGPGQVALAQFDDYADHVSYAPADVRDGAEVEAMMETIVDEQGGIDVLVNNAGTPFEWAPFHELSREDWDEVIDMYYRSRLLCTDAALEYMIPQESGTIVNLVTDAGRLGTARESVFAGTMGAIIAWTKSIAREMARYSVRANCVACAGVAGTNLYNSLQEGEQGEYGQRLIEAIEEQTPLELAEPSDIADVMVYLASERSQKITGQVISANGGLSYPG
jgi:2-hydroxycyclohexanecarboxyl-CoA dehydrogenase